MKLFNILYYYYIGIIITKMERPEASIVSRASKGVQQRPLTSRSSFKFFSKRGKFHSSELIPRKLKKFFNFSFNKNKIINFFTYENMKNYLIFMRKSMKIQKISISSKIKKSFIFDGIIMKIINRDFPLKI